MALFSGTLLAPQAARADGYQLDVGSIVTSGSKPIDQEVKSNTDSSYSIIEDGGGPSAQLQTKATARSREYANSQIPFSPPSPGPAPQVTLKWNWVGNSAPHLFTFRFFPSYMGGTTMSSQGTQGRPSDGAVGQFNYHLSGSVDGTLRPPYQTSGTTSFDKQPDPTKTTVGAPTGSSAGPASGGTFEFYSDTIQCPCEGKPVVTATTSITGLSLMAFVDARQGTRIGGFTSLNAQTSIYFALVDDGPAP